MQQHSGISASQQNLEVERLQQTGTKTYKNTRDVVFPQSLFIQSLTTTFKLCSNALCFQQCLRLPTMTKVSHNTLECPQCLRLPSMTKVSHNTLEFPQCLGLPTMTKVSHNTLDFPQCLSLPTVS